MPTLMRLSSQRKERYLPPSVGIFSATQSLIMCTFLSIRDAFSRQTHLLEVSLHYRTLQPVALSPLTSNLSSQSRIRTRSTYAVMLNFSPISAFRRRVSCMWTNSTWLAPSSLFRAATQRLPLSTLKNLSRWQASLWPWLRRFTTSWSRDTTSASQTRDSSSLTRRHSQHSRFQRRQSKALETGSSIHRRVESARRACSYTTLAVAIRKRNPLHMINPALTTLEGLGCWSILRHLIRIHLNLVQLWSRAMISSAHRKQLLRITPTPRTEILLKWLNSDSQLIHLTLWKSSQSRNQ